MSSTNNLIKRKFDGADIHWFNCFFKLSSISIKDPFKPFYIENQELEDKSLRYNVANKISLNGSDDEIKKIISFGKIGLLYSESLFNSMFIDKEDSKLQIIFLNGIRNNLEDKLSKDDFENACDCFATIITYIDLINKT